jgi:hypothetical protein
MSDADQTSTLATDAPDAPAPPPAQPVQPAYAGAPAPRFVDQVMSMRAVIAVALATLIIGGLGGFVLGERTNGGDGRFGHGGFPGGMRQGGTFPQQGHLPPQGQVPNPSR